MLDTVSADALTPSRLMLDTSPRRFSAAVQPRRWAGVPGAERGRAALSGGVGGDRGRPAGHRGGGEGRGEPADAAFVVVPLCRGGLEALVDRSHRPRSCPHQMDPAVEVRLVELRGLHPGWGPDRLLYRLGREGVEPLPSRAAIGRALARLGLVRAARRSRRRVPEPPRVQWRLGSAASRVSRAVI